jgi:GTP-binding protein Era
MINPENFRSGFAAIVGAPNVGKSTLMNRMLGEKISITSKKPQTTRNRILGVVHRPSSQIVFIDTPGIHDAKSPLNVRIVDIALSALGDVDVSLLVVDATHPDERSEALLIEILKKQNRPVVLALNKIDLVEKNILSNIVDAWSNTVSFFGIIPISAKHGTHVDMLLDHMERVLPKGPPYFPEDALTDVPERFIVAEIIREKAFRLTGQEIPYSVAVTTDTFSEDTDHGIVRIHATLHVERDSQKGIVIGKKGQKLRQIGESARMDIERMIGTKVFLKLFVRVQENWSKDTKALRRFGY